MIEIIKYQKNKKQSVLAGYFAINVHKWGGFIIEDMKHFIKDDKSWVSFPQKEYEYNGEKKYVSYNKFQDPKINSSFSKEILNALDNYLKTNQEPEKIYSDSELPF
jgi:hypothetical protein